MPEVRVDPLSGHRTIVAARRATRPGGQLSASAPEPIDIASDPFAEGHENRTPPELHAVRAHGPPNGPGWTVRVIPNLYPALSPDSPQPAAQARPELFHALAATGAHEVIINGPQSVMSLAALSAAQAQVAIGVWRERVSAHAASAYTQLIVNERREAGASLPHTHAQLYALDFVPAEVARERERFHAYATQTMGRNLLEDVIAEEVRLRDRLVAHDEQAVLVAPYASRMPYQLMLVPRAPRARFEDEGPLGAALLHDGLCRLARVLGASPPLNMWLRTAPRGAEHFCWRIDIAPRLTHLAGLELSTGVNLNIVAPETVAAQLRDA